MEIEEVKEEWHSFKQGARDLFSNLVEKVHDGVTFIQEEINELREKKDEEEERNVEIILGALDAFETQNFTVKEINQAKRWVLKKANKKDDDDEKQE